MKDLFYYFGMGRSDQIVTLYDPISIRDDFIVSEVNEHSLRDYCLSHNINLKKYLNDLTARRGILFAVPKNNQKAFEFSSWGKLLIPEVRWKHIGIFFLPDNKSVLIKFNHNYSNWNEIKRAIWSFLKPLKMISEQKFRCNTVNWHEQDYDLSVFMFECSEMKISAGAFQNLIVCIKPKEYSKFECKIKQVYLKYLKKQ